MLTGKIQPILARRDDRYLRLREADYVLHAASRRMCLSRFMRIRRSQERRAAYPSLPCPTRPRTEAAALARKENKADLIGGPDLGAEDPDAAGELLRMFQRESMNQSSHLAAAILTQIRDMPGGDRRGHRFAGFAVLKAPDMPSVLVEMGFLSNRTDEEFA